MQKRHLDRRQYFKELAITSERYFLPYILKFHSVNFDTTILEIGCGEGGNLLPFAKLGCEVVGIDISEVRIMEAISLFRKENMPGTFIHDNILNVKEYKAHFDIIICHDVIEHLSDKRAVLSHAHYFLKENGVLFVAFPAWHMPFGGHQQICKSRVLSKLPFIHLLPYRIYSYILTIAGESSEVVNELLSIKKTGITIETFEAIACKTKWEEVDRRLYLINPHYEIKFGLQPRVLPACLAAIPYLRNLFSTSCFYVWQEK